MMTKTTMILRLALLTAGLCLTVALASATAGDAPTGWRAPNGGAYWRLSEDGVIAWELADTDGRGAVDAAVYHCGDRYSRVEIDTDDNGAADRIYLFAPDGDAAGYLDTDGDGVLERPTGSLAEQRRQLHEIGRGGERFNKLLALRYQVDQQQLPAADGPAPEAYPPFPRPAGRSLTFDVNLTLIPGTPEAGFNRQENPSEVGRISLAANAGIGRAYRRLPVRVRTDPTGIDPAINGVLDATIYPVWIAQPDPETGADRTLILQLTGHLTAGSFDELFFLTEELHGNRPATVYVPVHDRAGRPAGSLLIEIFRP